MVLGAVIQFSLLHNGVGATMTLNSVEEVGSLIFRTYYRLTR
jgi:hypothetical protein